MPDDKNHYAVRKSDTKCDCVTDPWKTHSMIQLSGHWADARDGLQTDFILIKVDRLYLLNVLSVNFGLSVSTYLRLKLK